MTISALPTPPSRSDSANFAARGDAFMAALPNFVTQANALQSELRNTVSAATGVAALTWAALLGIVDMVAGDSRLVTDVGGGSIWLYDGTRWKPVGGSVVLGHINTGTAKTDANTASGILGSIMVLGGLLGIKDCLEYEALSERSGGASVNWGLNYGGVSMHSAAADTPVYAMRGTVQAQGSIGQQASTGASPSYGSHAGINQTTVDSSADQLVSVVAGFGAAGAGSNSVNVRGLFVRLIRA